MELSEVFSKTKWGILSELSKGQKSASEIAKKTGQTLANTTIQLKILEAKGIVRKAKNLPEPNSGKRGKGKPSTPYELTQGLVMIGLLRPGLASLDVSPYQDLNDFQKYLINSRICLGQNGMYAMMRYACETDLIKKADMIALVSESNHEVHLFLILESGLSELRQKHSNLQVDSINKTKKIISWSHNIREVEEGLERKEEYFLNLVRSSRELLDKKGLHAKWKNEQAR